MAKKKRNNPEIPILRYFSEEIACKIGLQEAIVLQQIEYWIKANEKAEKNFYDDHYWTFNSLEDWSRQFPFWSKKTTQRVLEKLRGQKILITSNEYNRRQNDQTLWYRIDYERLKEITMDSLTIPIVNLTTDTENNTEDKQETFSQVDHNDVDNLTTDLSQSDQIELDNLTTTLPIVSNSYSMVSYSYKEEKESSFEESELQTGLIPLGKITDADKYAEEVLAMARKERIAKEEQEKKKTEHPQVNNERLDYLCYINAIIGCYKEKFEQTIEFTGQEEQDIITAMKKYELKYPDDAILHIFEDLSVYMDTLKDASEFELDELLERVCTR